MTHFFYVALGGAIGASLRHLVNLTSLRWFGPNFPWGTATANILGSFVMGLFVELMTRRLGGSQELRLFIATGLLGGFTTFSAFSLDVAVLWERGAMSTAFIYAVGSVVLSIVALFVGLAVARTFA